MLRALRLGLIFSVMAFAIQGMAKGPADFPLQKGNWWIYEGNVGWTEGAKKFNQAISWKMEVIEVVKKTGLEIALIKGFPDDLAFYERGKERGNYLIVRDSDKYWLVRLLDADWQKSLGNISFKNGRLEFTSLSFDLILQMPLRVGQKFAQEDVNRTDNQYCWFVCDRISWGNRKGFRLVYETGPDDTTAEFVPGVGITRFAYNHHGTYFECDVKLIKTNVSN